MLDWIFPDFVNCCSDFLLIVSSISELMFVSCMSEPVFMPCMSERVFMSCVNELVYVSCMSELIFADVGKVTMDTTVKKGLSHAQWPTFVRMGVHAMWKGARPNADVHTVSTWFWGSSRVHLKHLSH